MTVDSNIVKYSKKASLSIKWDDQTKCLGYLEPEDFKFELELP